MTNAQKITAQRYFEAYITPSCRILLLTSSFLTDATSASKSDLNLKENRYQAPSLTNPYLLSHQSTCIRILRQAKKVTKANKPRNIAFHAGSYKPSALAAKMKSLS